MMRILMAVWLVFCLSACGKVCVSWEPEVTGRKCVHSTALCVPVFTGKTLTQTCTYPCVEWKPCRKCIFKMDDDDPGLPAEITRPVDACE